MIRVLACIVVAVALYLSSARAETFAQSATTLTGTIKDQNDAVIVNATVELLNVASGRMLKTKTDLSGKYEFADLSSGSYQLTVNSDGFVALVHSIAISRNRAYQEDFVLLPGMIESELTVTAGKGGGRIVQEVPQTVTITDASQIEQRRPWSTLKAIERTPNLTPVIANPMLERPRLRGLASNRLLLVLDGERLNNVRSDPTLGVSPSVIDVTQLEAAEVLSGAGSSLYGSDAMAGVINLITAGRSPTDYGSQLGFRFNADARSNGPFRRGAATIDWSKPSFAFRLKGSVFRQADYSAGNQSISVDEVVRLGRLAVDMGNAAGNNVARTFAVWSMNAGEEISNAQAHGFNDQVDLWFYPNPHQSLRYRQLNSQHKNLGFSFIKPPFDPRTQFNSFRRLDKYGLRYEWRELSDLLQRFAVGFYRQKYSFPDDTITSSIVSGSSWTFEATPDGPIPILTGNRSAFTGANISNNKNSITTSFADVQATLTPLRNLMITTGLGFLRDSSADEFSRTELIPPFRAISGRASNPDSVYTNWGWFSLIEHEPAGWLRVIGGLRIDNWRTEARVTSGFPLGAESALNDVGVKIKRSRWNASAGYFVNNLRDFIGSAFGPLLFVPPDPTRGLDPISPFFPLHGVLYVQRTNTARARIRGFEATYEGSFELGRAGVITSFGSLGLLKGSNLTPDQDTLNLIAQFYNRADTPVPLSGSANDAPLSSITPWRTINGIRVDNSRRRWFGEYEIRYQGQVKRADPLDLSAAISTEYGTLGSLNSFAVQALRGGYTLRQENYRIALSLGMENLTNRFYFEHFQTAPAPGRSIVFGTTLEFFNLLSK